MMPPPRSRGLVQIRRTRIPRSTVRWHSDSTQSSGKTATESAGSNATTPAAARPGFFLRTLPPSCIDFSSIEGKTIFAEALADGTMEGYFKLAGHYHAQSEPSFCGIAVLCMVLNSLTSERTFGKPFRWYSEERMSCCVPLEVVKKNGIDFDLFSTLATRHGAGIIPYRYPQKTEEEFREDIDLITRKTDEFIVASYDRASLSQTGHGHFSPIAGYHKQKDLVLLLDVARFKYPPHWVSVTALYNALQPVDASTSKSRGYYKVTKGSNSLCKSLEGKGTEDCHKEKDKCSHSE